MKRENKIAIISFILSVLLMAIIGFLAITLIHDNLDVEYIEENFVSDISCFVSEKSETVAYALITFLFPIAFIAIYKILDKKNFDIDTKTLEVIIGAVIFVLIILIIRIASENVYYILQTLIYNYLLKFFIAFLICIATVILYQKLSSKKAKKIFKIILYALAIAVILAVGFMYINNSYAQIDLDAHHFGAYYYPIYKIASGLTPGVDFNSLYGYYSYFFFFILNLLGGVSILKFSYVVTILIVISFACLAIFSNKLIKNKVLWIFCVLALIFTLSIHEYLLEMYSALQYTPHRLIFPVLMLIYLLIYNKFREKHEVLRKIGGVLLCTARNVMEFRNRCCCAWRLDNVSRI